ncbi:efflux RND transporter periplasmic adaptor subunit [Desulfovibrio sp. OttesenSCG-928-C14]|nr:efflux RND transporter periplasmic adaptor subunit [Desulfovibrio sp. OttesenSCG-928-C14]
MIRKNTWNRFLCLCAVLALGAALSSVLTGCGNDKAQAEAGRARPAQVKYMTVESRSITLTRELPGRVSALMISEVRPQVSGIIKERLFEEGSDVEAGQILYKIDPALYEAACKNAKAALARAEANAVSSGNLAARYARLIKTNAISRQEYDDAQAAHKQARAEVESAQAALETAAINLGYTNITAPVSGRIGRSFVTPGALVTQNQAQPLATVQQIDEVYIDVTQSNTELLRLRRALAAGQLRSGGENSAKIRLKLEDGSPYASNNVSLGSAEKPEWIEGDLLFSDVTIGQGTGSVTLRARIANPKGVLMPGMYVRAVLEEGVSEHAVLVPQKAVQRDTRSRAYVYVLSGHNPYQVEEGSAALGNGEFYVAQRLVELDRDYENQWLIRSGLREGDLVLLEGHMKARPGAVVAGLDVNAAPQTLASSQNSDAGAAQRN